MILYYRKANNERRDVIQASTFREAVESLYRGLDQQNILEKKVFNLIESSTIYFVLIDREYSFIPKDYTAHEVLLRYSHLTE
tara:strand:- start:1104 stop:1349 length:246 start_codon:yes stop_codon:yes gene_type:complete